MAKCVVIKKVMSALAFAGIVLPFLASEETFKTRVLPNPSGSGSGEACLWVHDHKLYMSWIEAKSRSEGTLMMSVFDGASWREPTRVYSSDQLFINWADFPQIVVTDDLAVITWLEKLGSGTYAYGVRFKTSADGGRSWSGAGWLHEDRGPTEHGFVALAPLAKDRVGAIWLDGRAMSGEHGGHEGGAMQLRYRTIGAKELGPEWVLDDMTCECCGTDLVNLNGKLTAVYRNKSEEQIRDIYAATLGGEAWSEGDAVGKDDWQIHGCPVNGPALYGRGDQLAVAWFTGFPKPAVRLKTGEHGRFGQATTFGEKPLGRVDCVVSENGLVYVAWLEAGAEREQLMLARFKPGTTPVPVGDPYLVDNTPAGRVSGFPRLALLEDRLIVAYQDPEEKGLKLMEITF